VKLTDLRGILQYIPQFREKTFILAVDGAIVTDENFATLLLDVAVLRSLNIRVVLVHGASAQIKALADEQKIQASDSAAAASRTRPRSISRSPPRTGSRTKFSKVFRPMISAHQHECHHRPSDGHHPGRGPFVHRKVERVDVEMLQSLLNQAWCR